MRRPFLGFAAAFVVVVCMSAGQAHAQNGAGDPFQLYYGYYLPSQAALAAQPSPLDSINQMTLRRQQSAQTDRSTLYDPISPYGDEESDRLSPYARGRTAAQREIRPHVFQQNANASNARGYGPSMFYSRYAGYYPQLKAGRGPNRNIAQVRFPRSSMGGGSQSASSFGGGGGGNSTPSMPSMPSINPGPR